MNKSLRHSSRQGGFTLIEIMVVILIIGILAAYFGPSLFGQTNDAKINVTRTQLTNALPTAMVGYYTTHDYSQVPTPADLTDRGVKPDSPWGGNWTVSGDNATGVTVDYPTGDSNASENATTILAQLKDGDNIDPNFPMITAATSSDTGVQITYDVN